MRCKLLLLARLVQKGPNTYCDSCLRWPDASTDQMLRWAGAAVQPFTVALLRRYLPRSPPVKVSLKVNCDVKFLLALDNNYMNR